MLARVGSFLLTIASLQTGGEATVPLDVQGRETEV